MGREEKEQMSTPTRSCDKRFYHPAFGPAIFHLHSSCTVGVHRSVRAFVHSIWDGFSVAECVCLSITWRDVHKAKNANIVLGRVW
ncbi:hypothetical protein TNCV_2643421 [Trichonephila clavipes]|nr:hypothetical protein TNCV_2643421 [Trichonephila clavipes]